MQPKRNGFVIGLIAGVLAAAVGMVFVRLLAGTPDSKSTPSGPPRVAASSPSVGAEVPLLLLQTIKSGDPEGTTVAFLVREDVKGPDGSIAIPKGTPAVGKIVWSRSADVMDQLGNRPARLSITIDTTRDALGHEVSLAADPQQKEDHRIDLKRDEIFQSRTSLNVDSMWESPQVREALTHLNESIDRGDWEDVSRQVSSSNLLGLLANRVQLPNTKELADSGKLSNTLQALNAVKKGSLLTAVAGNQALLAIGAAAELGNLAGAVGNKLTGMLKAPNIRAPMGTPFKAYVIQLPAAK